MTSAERFEHMVAMAMQAWDATFPSRERYLASGYLALERRRFEVSVRERLAQSATVYELEIGEAVDRGFERGRLARVETHG